MVGVAVNVTCVPVQTLLPGEAPMLTVGPAARGDTFTTTVSISEHEPLVDETI